MVAIFLIHYIVYRGSLELSILSSGAKLSQMVMVMMKVYARPTYGIVSYWLGLQKFFRPISIFGYNLAGYSVNLKIL